MNGTVAAGAQARQPDMSAWKSRENDRNAAGLGSAYGRATREGGSGAAGEKHVDDKQKKAG